MIILYRCIIYIIWSTEEDHWASALCVSRSIIFFFHQIHIHYIYIIYHVIYTVLFYKVCICITYDTFSIENIRMIRFPQKIYIFRFLCPKNLHVHYIHTPFHLYTYAISSIYVHHLHLHVHYIHTPFLTGRRMRLRS